MDQKDNNFKIIHDVEAYGLVADIVNARRLGWDFQEIAELLNNKGYKPTYGEEFTPEIVKKIFFSKKKSKK